MFTWVSSSSNLNLICIRLDRGICNTCWKVVYPESQITHLPRVGSDHCPLLLSLFSNHRSETSRKPFRFYTMWFEHPEFGDFVKDLWNRDRNSLNEKVLDMAPHLMDWNKQVFGDIFKQKREILRRLAVTHGAIDRRNNQFLHDLEKELQDQLAIVMLREEKFWYQKSRINWMKDGDRNTIFFHLSTIIWCQKNKLEGLFDECNIWQTEKEKMHEIAVHYFQNLFMASARAGLPNYWPNLFKEISIEIIKGLNGAVSIEEVKATLFSIGETKALGPDGFPAIFFQKYWDLCKKKIIEMVQQVFQTETLPSNINQTLIALIPKNDSPTSMGSLRPISLCNTVYKIISKIIVNRLRPLLNDLVSPAQTSFVLGRQIIDNILLVQEMLNVFRREKGRKGYMAWKVDLSKAYDRINWRYILEVLWEIRIRDQMYELIEQCISTVEYRVLLNGEKTKNFKPNSGLRQGDPLSPYLFVLGMEKLSQLIQVCVDAKIWVPVKASRKDPEVSHVFFADDLILFAEATVDNSKLMRKCMDEFCKLSGQ